MACCTSHRIFSVLSVFSVVNAFSPIRSDRDFKSNVKSFSTTEHTGFPEEFLSMVQ